MTQETTKSHLENALEHIGFDVTDALLEIVRTLFQEVRGTTLMAEVKANLCVDVKQRQELLFSIGNDVYRITPPLKDLYIGARKVLSWESDLLFIISNQGKLQKAFNEDSKS